MNLSAPKQKILLWSFFILSFFLFFLIKYQGSSVTQHFYQNNAVEVLNRLSDVGEKQSFEYYLGQVENNVWGPLAVLVSSLAFMIFALKFLPEVNVKKFSFAVFVFLLITKFDVLFFPPYGEVVAGPFAEALWLHHHSFDYVGLSQEISFTDGGPKVYLFSLYPGFLALLMKLIPSAKVFLVVNHLFVFAMASIIVALFRAVLSRIYSPPIALLAAVVLLSLPLFHSMTEAINMEIPCVFFAMLSVYYLAEKKIIPASIMAMISALVKGPGGLACASVFVVGAVIFFFAPREKRRIKYLLWGLAAVLVGFSKLILMRFFINPVQPPAGTVRIFVGWQTLVEYSIKLMIVFGAGILVFVYFYFKDRQKNKDSRHAFPIRHYVPFILFTFATMWYGLYINVSVTGPRYQLLLAPFLVFVALFALRTFIKSEKAITTFLVGMIILFSLCSHGLFHKGRIESSTWSYNGLERSLEYRADLKMHMRLAKEIEERYSTQSIGAPFVVAQILNYPELGYVQKQLDVFSYGIGLTYMKQFTGIKDVNIPRTIWIGFYKNVLPEGLVYPIDPLDRVIKDIEYGDKKVALFRGGVAIEKARIIFEMYRSGILHMMVEQQKRKAQK